MVFLPHTNNVILLEPYCGTITEPGLPVKIPRRLKQWKRRLKVYSRPFILYRDYPNSLTLSNAGEPFLRLKPCSDPSRQGNVKKIAFIIKGRFMGILRAYSCFISLIHATWWDDIPYGILFPVNCILRIWLYFSRGCRAWHRNLRLMMEEHSEISKGWPRKDKMRIYILRFGFKYTLAF